MEARRLLAGRAILRAVTDDDDRRNRLIHWWSDNALATGRRSFPCPTTAMGYDSPPPRVVERLTPKERVSAALSNAPYDRIPVNLLLSDHAAHFVGASVAEYERSARLMADGQIAAQRYYGHDFLNVGPGLTGIPEALGAKIALPPSSNPFIQEPAVRQLAEIDRLMVPDPERAARLPVFLEAAELASREVGHLVPILMTVAGPFTTAAAVVGTETLLKGLSGAPDSVHRMLRIATDSIIRFARAALARGVGLILAEPTASGGFISPEPFEAFALPYLTEVVQEIIRASGGIRPTLHVCGRTQKLWKQLAGTGAAALSLDDAVDLAEAKEAVGSRVALIGNVRTTTTMFLGTPKIVRANVLECLSRAFDNRKGFILGLGCGLPVNTPPENVRALMEAARHHGRYPLCPAVFAD